MSQENIEVVGARENNLKEVSVNIPKNKLVVITGVSGSGKSSLAFDTIYAEGQRRYIETFSSYARQFLGSMDRPDVEQISGLSPVISIEQKTTGWNPRSTVGTTTEIYDFLRLLYARAGEAYSHVTGDKMVKYSEDQLLEAILKEYQGKKISILAPLVRSRKGHYKELFEQTRKKGFTKVRVDGETKDIVPGMKVDRYVIHDIEVVVDRISLAKDKKRRLLTSLQTALGIGNDLIYIEDIEAEEVRPYSKKLMCPVSGISYEIPSPNTFSFNSPYGTCVDCRGLGTKHQIDLNKVIPDRKKSIKQVGIVPLGEVRKNSTFTQLRKIAKAYDFTFDTPIEKIPEKALELILFGGDSSFSRLTGIENDYQFNLAGDGLVKMLQHWYKNSSSERIRSWAEEFISIETCPSCSGFRLKNESLHFKINGKHIGELAQMDLDDLYKWFDGIEEELSELQIHIAKDVLKEIRDRLKFLIDVGLNYLTMDRQSRTLSGGEAQRTRLATQIGSQLTGITYIMDEPSIGLHQRDNHRLIQSLKDLSNIGNTVIVVEHDKDIMLSSDYLIDIGPGAGIHGGEIIAEGNIKSFKKKKGITADYLSNKQMIEIPKKRRKGNGKKIVLKNARGHNLKGVNLEIPLGKLVLVTGVSGSGKSSLVNQTLYPIIRKHFYKSIQNPLPYDSIKGLEHIDKVIEIDQKPIGRTPRSNPATYTKLFDPIRNLFSNLPEAKIRGYKPGQFSFNVKAGRCEACQGGGQRVIEMNFLPDVYVDCETCMGQRYTRETLEILYKGKSISDVLNMTVEEATDFFESIPKIYRKLKTLRDVGLGYITLGQPSTTISGGEAQRVKLAEELSKRDTGNTLYILDEPTTGLHFNDVKILINVINRLVDKGNTVIIIEHNMDIIKVADHIIDVGPEGGTKGGEIVFAGTPEKLAKHKSSHTAKYLKEELLLTKK